MSDERAEQSIYCRFDYLIIVVVLFVVAGTYMVAILINRYVGAWNIA